MIKIELTNSNEVAIIDDEDFDLISSHSWFYCRGYAMTSYKGKSIFMHRMIMGFTEMEDRVDHIDGYGLNNQRSNLRRATPKQNSANKSANKNKSIVYKGVYRDKRTGAWKAAIEENDKKYDLGSYDSIEDAALAYDKAAIKRFGVYARLNLPDKNGEGTPVRRVRVYYGNREGLSSRYVGVSYSKRDNKWFAYFYRSGKRIRVGMFETEDEAFIKREIAMQLYDKNKELMAS